MENQASVRVLIVSNMWPSPQSPALGIFVRDQVDALRRVGGEDLELDVFSFPPGGYARAALELAKRRRRRRYDIVHAHFGLSAWPALLVPARRRAVTLHGTDLRHPRSRRITLLALPRMDLVAAVSDELAGEIPRLRARTRLEILPCGVATNRFRPIPRSQARAGLGLEGSERHLLFPADPGRPGKRHDRALAVADAVGARLLTLGDVPPERVALFINAADAVLVPSEHEGFGLAVLEALACDVPVLATPTGIHERALENVPGTLCAPFDLEAWTRWLAPLLEQPDPRIEGRARAERYSADAMAQRVMDIWRDII